ncbi:MAG: class I SAM-dependent methyltransferase [Candidatus Pacearchaeota archaeon]
MSRWQTAQVHEKDFWESRSKLKPSDRPEYNDYIQFIEKHLHLDKNTRILEIGCGPQTLVERMNGELYGLDPLMNYFLSTYQMEKNVNWQQGIGESLPYKDNFFDLIIIGNVLDHTESPAKVLEESYRCLKPNGFIFLVQNCYDSNFTKFKKFMEKIKLGDSCHPHTFTLNRIRNIFNSKGFKLISERPGFELSSSYEVEPNSKKINRLIKEKGIGYLIKHLIIRALNFVPKHIFKTYSLHVFMAKKV